MAAVGDSFRQAGVAAIYLVHGTFIGPDGLGLLAQLARLAPSLADAFRGWNKQLLDSVAGDLGNFTHAYAETWQSAINLPGAAPIPVRRFYWSSENHHLGRADGAVRLLDELLRQAFQPDQRVLLVCHSHGGNVAALATNLLGSDPDARHEFFQAARSYYQSPVWRRVDLPVWDNLRQKICTNDPGGTLLPLRIDIATLGTPVRYGWDSAGYERLLHLINHRPADGLPRYQAPFPPSAEDLWHARTGDFVQQLGIAGTNFFPPLWALRACAAEVRLGRLLQAEDSTLDLLARLRLGLRVHDEGDHVLIDYGEPSGSPAEHLFGHAIYTRHDWLLFHAELIAQQMYEYASAAGRQ